MGMRSKVQGLPEPVRDALNAKLIGNGFSNYTELTAWLTDQGFELSRASLYRYGSDLKAGFDEAMGDVRRSIEMAKASAAAIADDESNLTDATVRIAQESLLRVTIALRQAEHEPEKAVAILAKISHALANLGRMGISLKEWQEKHRETTRRQFAEEAAQAISEELRGEDGMSEALENRLRSVLLGKA